MSLVADFDFETALYREALEEVPGMYLELDAEGVLRSGLAAVTFRAAGDDFGRFERALEADSTVEAVVPVETDLEGWRRYRTHVAEEQTMHHERAELGVVLLAASATHEGWQVRLRVPDRETLATYRDACDALSHRATLRGLVRSRDTSTERAMLTPAQHELLVAAHESGYFDVPRRVMVEELAHRFDITEQVAAERVRRGMETLLASYIENSAGHVEY